jgi:hypothetical protein
MSPKKIILAVSFLAVFSFLFNFNALSVKAMTVAKIQAMISQLQAQITQLQQQLAATQVTGTSWCHNFNINLKIGISGLDVEALQAALEKEGLYEKGTNSADFDEEIASAVVGFQEKYAGEILTPFKLKHGTGFVGTGTRAKLNKLYGCNVITTSTPTTSVPVTTSATTTTSVSTTTSASAATPTPAATPISSITPTQTPASSITVSSPSGGGSTVASTTATTSSPDLSEFKVVELVENNLPNSITFWTTAYCPGDGTAFDYTIPTGYQKEFCISGPNGSHGGCSSCAMREIKLIKVNPSITVISPNAGEQWMIGETHDIKWNATEVNNVMIDLVSGSNSWHLAYYLPASQATFSWNLGSTTEG